MDGEVKVLSGMALDDKISFLFGKNNWQTKDFPAHGIPSVFMADGPCGLRKQTGKGDHLGIEESVPATAMVSGGCLAATWNPECAYENGAILGEEAAAEQVDLVLAPAMNLIRSPLCGRNFEYLSEDPCLTGHMAAAYTEGIQSAHVDACLKHFAGNNQETEREYVNAVIDERTLRELYLPAFEFAIQKAKPLAVMSALNQVNGAYGAEQKHLITDILRNEWRYEGIVISDWYGVVHRDLAIKAGLDLEMPCTNGIGEKQVHQEVQDGRLSEEDINAACLRLLRAIHHIEENRAARKTNASTEALHAKNHQRARRIAQEGIVLLKNDQDALPLRANERVAVIGPCAKTPKITLDGSAKVICTEMDIPFEKMQELSSGQLLWAEGFRQGAEDGLQEVLAQEALRCAGSSERVVFFMSQADGVEKEGLDRTDLSMPAEQTELLERIYQINPHIVVVMTNASAVEMPWQHHAEAILECFLAGQGFGAAIAEILYGRVNPSGHLPVSFTKTLEDTSAYLHFPGDGRQVIYSEGVFCGYRCYDRKKTEVLYPFGHGLSYTSFSLSSGKAERRGDHVSVQITVENTGSLDGAQVVQLYVGGFDTEVLRPVRELKAFKKVFLKPSETTVVAFELSARDFAYYDVACKDWVAPEGNYRIEIGVSSRDIRWETELHLAFQNQPLPKLTGWSQMGEMKRVPIGKSHYQQAVAILREHMREDSVFLKLCDLDNEAVLDQLPMRLLTLLTNGLIDNDLLLNWIDDVNRSGREKK